LFLVLRERCIAVDPLANTKLPPAFLAIRRGIKMCSQDMFSAALFRLNNCARRQMLIAANTIGKHVLSGSRERHQLMQNMTPSQAAHQKPKRKETS